MFRLGRRAQIEDFRLEKPSLQYAEEVGLTIRSVHILKLELISNFDS